MAILVRGLLVLRGVETGVAVPATVDSRPLLLLPILSFHNRLAHIPKVGTARCTTEILDLCGP